MSAHLSTQEFVDALEGTLPDARKAHLSGCQTCADEVAELTGATQDARRAGDLPEPSPLFWDHFSARVRAATDGEAIRPLSWWERNWRPLVALSAVAATAMFAVVLYNGKLPLQPMKARSVATAARAPIEPAVDEDSFELMIQFAAGASTEELQAARPGQDTTGAAIQDLTPEQQAEFIRLIKAEIGEQQ